MGLGHDNVSFLAFCLNGLPVHGLSPVDLGKGGKRSLVGTVGQELAVAVLGNVGKVTTVTTII